MAKVIQESQQQVVVNPWWNRERAGYIGLSMGLLWWVLTALLRHYVVEPIACRDLDTASACVNAVGISGNIAAIIIAVIGTVVLVRNVQPRPIIISVGTAILLWSLGSFMDGIAWYWAILWALFFYGASYVLFSLITRLQWLVVSLVVALVVVAAARIALTVWS